MSEASPARAYFEACRGRWRTPVAITVTDVAALQRSGMSWFDRLQVRLLARWPRWLGRVFMDTSVAIDGSDVVHTTVIRWLVLPLMKSVEIFALDRDGSRFTVSGSMTGQGSVDPTATHAEYTLRWLGVEITQHTTREANLVTVHQQGPGFQGLQELQRQA